MTLDREADPRAASRRAAAPARRIGRRLTMFAAVAGLALALPQCIVTDNPIQLDEENNAHAVKIVEPVPSTVRAACDCTDARVPGKDSVCDRGADPASWDPEPCPQTVDTRVPHLLRPEEYTFCSCPVGATDSAPPLSGIELFVEDQDEGDDLYAALLLDVDLNDSSSSPASYELAGFNQPVLPLPPATDVNPIGQDVRHLRQIVLRSLDDTFDPCNDSLRGPLDPGWHELTIIVTDREWDRFEDGDGVVSDPEVGSPDFAAGASQDTTHYVFFCEAPDVAPCDTRCTQPDD